VDGREGRDLTPIGVVVRGVEWDLSLIGGADRRVHLPLSKWRGYGVDFFSSPDGMLGFQSKAWFQDGFSFSPLGETGEGFFGRIIPCQSKTLRLRSGQASSRIKKSPHRNFNAQKNSAAR